MPRFEIVRPSGVQERDAGRIHAFLAQRGFDVEAVSVEQDESGTVTRYVCDADRDPASEIEAYVPTPTDRDIARARMREIREKLIAGRATLVEINEAIAWLIAEIASDDGT